MGSAFAQACEGASGIELASGIERPDHQDLGSPFGKGVLTASLEDALRDADVVVDFSAGTGLEERVVRVAKAARPFVCGITGLGDAAVQALREAGDRIPVVWAPNFSLGINVLCELCARAAELLGMEYDVELVETHHRAKKDAPSGTALKLLDVLRDGTARGAAVFGREGQAGPKSTNEIGVHAVRTGDVVGEHSVVFGGPGERLELAHKATSRQAFAWGAVAAVRFAFQREPGFYGMADLLRSVG
jgi:4-hydroxy-tetrahydrodipicolinate reductase